MIRRFALVLALGAVLSGCAGSGGSVPPMTAARAGAVMPGGAPPAPASATVPVRPEFLRNAPPPPPSAVRKTQGVHAAFFAGETALSNGVYYLQLPNGNVFGYYSYLSDPHYIYHFEMGYAYVMDANDGKGGAYLYDFASTHWWYTSPAYAFPYLYDFTLNAVLYYFPEAGNAGHYTTKPRYFQNFTNNAIITLPSAQIAPGALTFVLPGGAASQSFTITEPGYAGVFTVDWTACAGIASVGPVFGNTYSVSPTANGTCNVLVGDTNGGRAAMSITVTAPVEHLYLGDAGPIGHGFIRYTLPLSASSTPDFVVGTTRIFCVGVDAQGAVEALDSQGNVGIYNAPLLASSTPAVSVHSQISSGSQQIAFDNAGDMYVSMNFGVLHYQKPFGNATVAVSTVTNAAIQTVGGVAFDAAQNMYVSSGTNASGSNLLVFAPPYTGTPIATPIVAGARYRGVAVHGSRLYVVSDTTNAYRVDVYPLPLHANTTAAFGITSGLAVPEIPALDAAGNLYVTNYSSFTISVYQPPFSAFSTPTFVPVPNGFGAYNIALGK